MPRISPRTIDEMSIGEFLSAISRLGRSDNVLYDGPNVDGPLDQPVGDEDIDDDEFEDEDEDEAEDEVEDGEKTM